MNKKSKSTADYFLYYFFVVLHMIIIIYILLITALSFSAIFSHYPTWDTINLVFIFLTFSLNTYFRKCSLRAMQNKAAQKIGKAQSACFTITHILRSIGIKNVKKKAVTIFYFCCFLAIFLSYIIRNSILA